MPKDGPNDPVPLDPPRIGSGIGFYAQANLELRTSVHEYVGGREARDLGYGQPYVTILTQASEILYLSDFEA